MGVHKKTKKKLFMIKETIVVILTVFLVYLGAVIMFEDIALFNRYQHYVIVSNSMEPTINVGDVVIIDKKIDTRTLKVDDIVAIDVTINNQDVVVVHYIHSIIYESNEMIFLTRPEGTSSPDSWELSSNDIIGIYHMKIPYFGRFLMFAQSTVGRIVIIVDVIAIYLIYVYFWKKRQDSKKVKP